MGRPGRGIRGWPQFRRAWFAARALIGTQPRLLPLLRFAPATPSEQLVLTETDVCIEGFPRSGNTFAARYFRQFTQGARVAHHIHLPAQLLLAVEYRVPRVLLPAPAARLHPLSACRLERYGQPGPRATDLHLLPRPPTPVSRAHPRVPIRRANSRSRGAGAAVERAVRDRVQVSSPNRRRRRRTGARDGTLGEGAWGPDTVFHRAKGGEGGAKAPLGRGRRQPSSARTRDRDP